MSYFTPIFKHSLKTRKLTFVILQSFLEENIELLAWINKAIKKWCLLILSSQRFEHLETYSMRLLHPYFTSYVLNLSAELRRARPPLGRLALI